MKVLLVANINSPHTRKWAQSLLDQNISVAVFSINPLLDSSTAWINQLSEARYPLEKEPWLPGKYRRAFRELKQMIREFKPDVLHSHFLTNYTFLTCLSGFHPHLATAWGSDVYLFPKQGLLNKWMLKYNLQHADRIISTSHDMATVIGAYTQRPVDVIPFGVDFSLYQSHQSRRGIHGEFHIACFKKLGEIYGQDILIEALSILIAKHKTTKIQLHLYGDGEWQGELKQMGARLGISQNITFHGWVPAEQVPALHQQADVCVYCSRRESFGVSLIEAMAAGVPLVVSEIPAFKEVAGQEGHVLFATGAAAVASAIEQVMLHPAEASLRCRKAYEYAVKKYDLQENIRQQIKIYQQALAQK